MSKNSSMVYCYFSMSFILIWSSTSLLSMWMIMELNTLSFIGVLMMNKTMNSEATLSYFIVQAFSSVILMVSLNINMMFAYFLTSNWLLLMMLMLKAGAAPLHFWVWGVSISFSWLYLWLFCGMQKIIPIVMMELMDMKNMTMFLIVMVSSLFFGSSLNMSTNNYKSMLIFLSISSMAWLMSSILVNLNLWKPYFLSFVILSAMLIYQLSPMSKKISLLSLMSLVGLPPWPTFIPKLLMAMILMEEELTWLLLLMLIMSVIEIFMILRQNHYSLLSQSKMKKKMKNQEKFPLILVIMSFAFMALLT